MPIQIPAQGWCPRHYQLSLVKYMMKDEIGQRAVIAWHRRAGKDLTCINIVLMKALQRKGLYLIVGPFNNQIRRIIWQGQTGEGKKFIDYIPRELHARKSEQEMSITLTNGSVIQLLGADNPDKLVGINPVGIVFSEYSLCDPEAWTLTSPILAENGGWAIWNGTPRGQNHFFTLLNRAKANKDWFSSHLSAIDTKAITPEALRKARDEQNNEAKFQSEFMCSFNTPIEGAYYGEALSRVYKKNQVLERLPPEPSLPVHTAWDLGMDDSTSIWFFQQFRQEVRILRYFENSGEGLPYYAREIDRWASLHDVSFGKHYFPHDVKVREMGSGHSRVETLRKLGIRATVVKKLSLSDGIEAVRNLLPRCWFNQVECAMGLEHLKGYHKDFDQMKQVFMKTPVHDSASHGADAMRMLALGIREVRKNDVEGQKERSTYKDSDLDW